MLGSDLACYRLTVAAKQQESWYADLKDEAKSAKKNKTPTLVWS